MGAIEPLQYVSEPPCVVADRISMSFRVPANDADPQAGGLRARFSSRPRMVTVQALKRFSLVAGRGESIGIVGRNGSGKSTLMKLISGQFIPSTGSVYASSTPVLLGVNAALVPELPGEHNIVLGCLAMGMSRDQVRERYDSIVELSGLDEAIHLPMRSYSSGMASRLRFAIAASIDPEILLIDEALNTGDAHFADRSRRRMVELRENAGCVFLVSHNLKAVQELCTRALWIDKGELLMDGEPGDVVSAYRAFSAELTKGDPSRAAGIRDEAAAGLTSTRVLQRSAGRRRAG